MITGYNTDVEHDGVAYHVQTEDKGAQSPEIISFVFVGGAILASKRTSYQDLIARGFDEDVLRKRLQRQHKLICAAVHAGRIEDLKRMTERESLHSKASIKVPQLETSSSQINQAMLEPNKDQVSTAESSAVDEGLVVGLIDEKELRGGETVTLRLLVTRAGRNQSGLPVTVKTLGTTFALQSTRSITDERGVAVISLALPNFKAGRAAILVQCEDKGEAAELRRIILPAKS